MKIIISNIFVLCLLILFFNGCSSNDSYSYRTKEFNSARKPIATVEKAWVARHKYDHERRLLIPMVGGTRWGAVQEYKEDGTLEFKDWWVRDVKIEDLEAKPSTTLSIENKKKIFVYGNGGSFADASHFVSELTATYKKKNRIGLPFFLLSSNISSLTAWSNDIYFESYLEREVKSLIKASR